MQLLAQEEYGLRCLLELARHDTTPRTIQQIASAEGLSPDYAAKLLRELRRGGYEPTFERVDTPEAMSVALAKQHGIVLGMKPTWDKETNLPSICGRFCSPQLHAKSRISRYLCYSLIFFNEVKERKS